MRRVTWVALAAVITCGTASVAASCSSSTYEQGPNDALRGYARALEENRIDDAYRYLSDDAKRSLTLEAFRRAVTENPTEVIEVARSLTRPTTDPVVVATVTVPSGEELRMVFEDGRWRVDASAVDLYSQGTPRQALVGFIRAFERKRYDVILRYVPDAERDGLDSDFGDTPAKDAPAPPAASASPSSAPSASPSGSPSAGPPAPPHPSDGSLTADLIKEAWEGPMHDRMNRTVQALKAALPTANIEETGEFASMAYGSGNAVSFVRERGAWKIKDL
ncbi:MAG: hypothetical protein U0414_34080 [Polyangiaceae bacterium]